MLSSRQIYIRVYDINLMRFCSACDVRYVSKSGRCPSCDGKGVDYDEQDKD